MVRAAVVCAVALLLAGAAAAAEPQGAFQERWVEAYRALDCGSPREGLLVASRAPLKLALITYCAGVPDTEKVGGGHTLVVVDEAAGTIEPIRIPGSSPGGLHEGPDGDFRWFDTARTTDKTHSDLVLYRRQASERRPERLGSIPLPFVGLSAEYAPGGDCGMVTVQAFRMSSSEPLVPPVSAILTSPDQLPETTSWLEVGRPKFWSVAEQAFVTDMTPRTQVGMLAPGTETKFRKVDCRGQSNAFEGPQARALTSHYGQYTRFAASGARDELLAKLYTRDLDDLALVSRDGKVSSLGPFHETLADPEEGYGWLASHVWFPTWSPSGRYFAARVDFDLYVFDAETLQRIEKIALQHPFDIPQFDFLDDRTIAVFSDHSRVSIARF